MGEFVEQSLEELLPVFEQIKHVNLFSEQDVRQIVKRCRAFEYRLQKQIKNSSNFLRYIDYLTNFLSLIKCRRETMDYWFKKTEIDVAIIRKIESLYRRACERFQGQLHLWEGRIEFAKKLNQRDAVSRLYFRLLQVHNDQPNLWIAASKFEFETNGSSENARNLLHKALRFLPNCEKLWVELFHLELKYVKKILDRKAKLELEKSTVTTSDGTKDDNAEISVSDAVLRLKLPELILEQILEKNSDKSELLLSFWRVANQYEFANVLGDRIFDVLSEKYSYKKSVVEAKVERRIWQLEKDYRKDTEGLAVVIEPSKAVRERREKEMDDAAAEIFEAALRSVQQLNNAEKIWRCYLDFFRSRYEMSLSETSQIDSIVSERKNRIISIFNHVISKDWLSPTDFQSWANLVEGYEEKSKILSVALEKYPKSPAVWLEKLKTEILSKHDWSDNDRKSVMKIFNRAVQNVPERETLPLWELAFKWTVQHCPKHTEKVLKSAESLLSSEVSGKMRILYLQWIFEETHDMGEVRKLFRKFCQLPNSLDFYATFILLENSSLKSDLSGVRQAFERAIREYGTESVQLWLDYLEFEKSRDPANIPSIYQRALKNLNETYVENFVEKWSLIRSS